MSAASRLLAVLKGVATPFTEVDYEPYRSEFEEANKNLPLDRLANGSYINENTQAEWIRYADYEHKASLQW